ncbi:MAG: ABC transporter permease [Candidatus Micrarchaeota archaeon]|nr:ABC transporter permease [Candidatus Micrarchaeota archaeon]
MVRKNIASQLWASVLVNAVYAMENYPIMLINTLLAPLSIFVIIVLVSHGGLLSVGIVGALVMTMITAGVGLQGDLSHLKNDMKLQDMVVSSPTSSLVYVAGMGLSELVFASPVIILLAVLATVYVHPTLMQTVTIMGVMALTFVFSIVLGFILSTLTTDVVQSWGFSGAVGVVLSTLPPVYYPISYIPMPFQYIAYISPTTYAAQIAQSAIGFTSVPAANLAVDWGVLIAVCAALVVLAIKKARWREP